MSDGPEYDLEDVYDTEIAPLMDQIIGVCKAHGLPMVATFCYRNSTEDGTDLCTTTLPRGDWQPQEIRNAVKAITTPRNGFMAFTITNSAPGA